MREDARAVADEIVHVSDTSETEARLQARWLYDSRQCVPAGLMELPRSISKAKRS